MQRELAEQPTAPYLDAVVAYGFRGSARFHTPGHKGGEGADPGLRSALGDSALLFDVPQDIEGIDAGPSPTPYERAEQLAADAYGAAALVSHQRSDPGQPRPLSRACSAWHARAAAAQLARQLDRRARAERRDPELRLARIRPRARHGARRHARGAGGCAAARAPTRAPRSSSHRPIRDGRRHRAGVPPSPTTRASR